MAVSTRGLSDGTSTIGEVTSARPFVSPSQVSNCAPADDVAVSRTVVPRPGQFVQQSAPLTLTVSSSSTFATIRYWTLSKRQVT